MNNGSQGSHQEKRGVGLPDLEISRCTSGKAMGGHPKMTIPVLWESRRQEGGKWGRSLSKNTVGSLYLCKCHNESPKFES